MYAKIYFWQKNINHIQKKLPTFVIIDFRNTFMHYLRALFHNSRFILIDDGFQTYVNCKYIEKNLPTVFKLLWFIW